MVRLLNCDRNSIGELLLTDPHANSKVWCWGWDGAGDLDGPDVDPIWEKMPDYSFTHEAIKVKHDRSFSACLTGLATSIRRRLADALLPPYAEF